MKTFFGRLFVTLGTITGLSAFAGQGEKVDLPAPEVTGVNQDGKEIVFSEVYAKGPTVVFFYPKANTPGCTKQACSLRDAYEELTQQGVQVLGVSADKEAAQKKFIEDHKLPFDLIADPEGKVIDAFGVSKMVGVGLASRQCFLIVKGRIVWKDSKASTAEQANDILRELKTLSEAS